MDDDGQFELQSTKAQYAVSENAGADMDCISCGQQSITGSDLTDAGDDSDVLTDLGTIGSLDSVCTAEDDGEIIVFVHGRGDGGEASTCANLKNYMTNDQMTFVERDELDTYMNANLEHLLE